MKLRRLNIEGVAQFAAYLAQLRTEPTLTPPNHLLTQAESSEAVADVDVEAKPFATRFDAAEYLDAKLAIRPEQPRA